MTICIFCPATLDVTTKPEHILHAALGGRKSTRRVICSACNNKFGGGIDKVLVEQFAGVRNLLQLRSGNGEPPPMIRRLKAGRDVINIGRDGKISTVEKPFTIYTDEEGQSRLSIVADSFEKIEAMIPDMAAALKIPEESLRDRLSRNQATITNRRPDPIQLGFQFGGPEAMRSAAKACLVLWAALVGNNEVRSEHYAAVRDFIVNGDASFLEQKTKLDSRFLEVHDQVAAEYGPFFSLIYVKSDDTGRVIGHFTVYNLIAFQVVIAERGASANRRMALVSNPVTSAWSDRFAELVDISSAWLEQPDYDYVDMQRTWRRFDVLMQQHTSMAWHREIERIIKDVLKGSGLKEGELIPQEMMASISAEIGHRVSHHLFNLPVTKTVTPERMKEIFGGKDKEI